MRSSSDLFGQRQKADPLLAIRTGKFIKIWRQAEGNAEADRRTKLLLGNAAHEARTPLNAVVGYLDLALQEEGVEGELRESLTRSATASKSLINVVNDLLDLAKGEGRAAEPVENAMDMEIMLEEATSMHRQVAQQKGLRFGVVSSQTSPCPRLVVGDASQLRKVVSNLCANAVQHTTTGGVLVQWGIEEQVIIEGDESAGQAQTDEISVAITM